LSGKPKLSEPKTQVTRALQTVRSQLRVFSDCSENRVLIANIVIALVSGQFEAMRRKDRILGNAIAQEARATVTEVTIIITLIGRQVEIIRGTALTVRLHRPGNILSYVIALVGRPLEIATGKRWILKNTSAFPQATANPAAAAILKWCAAYLEQHGLQSEPTL
jgi:hypothetical protein